MSECVLPPLQSWDYRLLNDEQASVRQELCSTVQTKYCFSFVCVGCSVKGVASHPIHPQAGSAPAYLCTNIDTHIYVQCFLI